MCIRDSSHTYLDQLMHNMEYAQHGVCTAVRLHGSGVLRCPVEDHSVHAHSRWALQGLSGAGCESMGVSGVLWVANVVTFITVGMQMELHGPAPK